MRPRKGELSLEIAVSNILGQCRARLGAVRRFDLFANRRCCMTTCYQSTNLACGPSQHENGEGSASARSLNRSGRNDRRRRWNTAPAGVDGVVIDAWVASSRHSNFAGFCLALTGCAEGGAFNPAAFGLITGSTAA